MKVVVIPRIVKNSTRIGGAFSDLFRIIVSCEDDNEITFNFLNATFFHPFFIAPLAIYCDSCGKKITNENLDSSLRDYLDVISFNKPKIIRSVEDVDDLIATYSTKTYTPVCKFPIGIPGTEKDQIVSRIQNLVEIQSQVKGPIKDPLTYMFSELITNIGDHSCSEYGYIYSQYLPREGCVNLCIADCGINILGSYLRTGKYTDKIQDNPAKALQLAVEGYSTKDRPDMENRGYGISSSIKMLVNGMHGSFFILSGNAFYRHDANGKMIVRLPDTIAWNGTIILLKIPTTLPADFDYYRYLE